MPRAPWALEVLKQLSNVVEKGLYRRKSESHKEKIRIQDKAKTKTETIQQTYQIQDC